MNHALENRICLVTGATRGIGRAIATTLSQNGATVYGTATSESGAQAISAYLNEAGLSGEGMVLDVNDAEQVAGVVETISERSGAVEVLVNNAGITRDNLLLRMKSEEWDDIMSTNLRSAFLTSKACLRGMTKARFGRIINISSVVGSTGNAGQSNYSAAKAGMTGFSKSLAQEVASRGITVNVVAPGFIETDMTAVLTDEQKSAITGNIPLKRMGTPADIAAAVLFLASDSGAYITGETIHVNGGMYMA